MPDSSANARRFVHHLVCLGLAVLLAAPAAAQKAPRVVLIIDDLGQDLAAGERVTALPGPVACAFLPARPHVNQLARQCHEHGKEVLLHQPLQAAAANDLGPGGITLDMSHGEVLRVMRENLAGIPHVSGMNTHMGSLLTRHPGHMAWVIEGLEHNLPDGFFVDSVTTPRSVGRRMAAEAGIPHARRHIFLDPVADSEVIKRQFQAWLAHARRDGLAIAIGHPYPETLALLERELPRLADKHGVTLVSVRAALVRQQEEGPWPASLSPLPPAVKSSKP